MSVTSLIKPSWLRWPPNCCETCISWDRSATDRWIGVCKNSISTNCAETTDARYRCPTFERTKDVA